MKRLSSYEPFNKMADAVLYGGIVALTFGSIWQHRSIFGPSFHRGVCHRFWELRTYSLVALSAGSFLHVSPCHFFFWLQDVQNRNS